MSTVSYIVYGNENMYFQYIQQAVNNVKIDNQLNMGSTKEECYPDIGCFTTDGPMKHTLILPESPEKIDTKFYVYSDQSPTNGQIVDAYNPKT